jgi:hypothetical protein
MLLQSIGRPRVDEHDPCGSAAETDCVTEIVGELTRAERALIPGPSAKEDQHHRPAPELVGEPDGAAVE